MNAAFGARLRAEASERGLAAAAADSGVGEGVVGGRQGPHSPPWAIPRPGCQPSPGRDPELRGGHGRSPGCRGLTGVRVGAGAPRARGCRLPDLCQQTPAPCSPLPARGGRAAAPLQHPAASTKIFYWGRWGSSVQGKPTGATPAPAKGHATAAPRAHPGWAGGSGGGSQPQCHLGPGVEADDGPVVPHQVPQLVQVGVDVLLHPLLHRVGEVDPLQVGTQVADEALPVLVEPGRGRAGGPAPCGEGPQSRAPCGRPGGLAAPSPTYFSTLLPKRSMLRGLPNWRLRW